MVYYFKAEVQSEKGASEYDDFALGSDEENEEAVIYMGKDKFENEHLLKHSHPKNIWFHVDNYSSAHLYLQLSNEDQLLTFDTLKIDDSILKQLAQLTKANSIKANKLNNITIIYTPVNNLYTDGSMDAGTVTFHNPKKVKRIVVAKKENAIVNKLNKTKYEITTEDFIKNQQALQRQYLADKKNKEREIQKQERELAKQHEEQKKRNTDPYADLFTKQNKDLNSNEFRNENWVEEEFW